MGQKIDECKLLYERYFDLVGRAVDWVVAEADQASGEPLALDPARHIRLLGQMAILHRLLDGAPLPLDLVRFFFDDKAPTGSPPAFPVFDAADPGPETCSPEFHAELRRLADYFEARLRAPADAEPVPAA